MMDLSKNLNSLGFEAGLTEEEKEYSELRSRSAGLTVSGCGHAVFVCQLVGLLRKKLVSENGSPKTHFCVGILGGGHMGKQLATVLLHVSSLKLLDINISTKRPETLEEISKMGVECYYDNARLAKWADVLFICVLPCHISQVCADLRSHLPPCCLVYSFPSAVPLNRSGGCFGLGGRMNHSVWKQFSQFLKFTEMTPETSHHQYREGEEMRSHHIKRELVGQWRHAQT